MYHVQEPQGDNTNDDRMDALNTTKINPKTKSKNMCKSRQSKASRGQMNLQIDESKSEADPSVEGSEAMLKIPKTQNFNNRPSSALSYFYDQNFSRNESKSDYEDEVTNDLIDKLENDVKYRSKYNF